MQAANRVAKNTLILYARMAITVFISLYSTRLVLEALGASDFGIFNLIGGAIVMLTFLNAAMASATQRFMSYHQGEGNKEKQKSIFNVSVILHILIAIVIVLLLEVSGYFLFDGILKIEEDRIDAAKLIYQFLIVSTLFTIISVPYDAVIVAHENMFFVAILGVIEALLKFGSAIYITYTSFDKLTSYGLLIALVTVVLLFIRRGYCIKFYEEAVINFRKHIDKVLFKEMTSFAGWSFLFSSSSMLTNYGQGIVINMFFGTVVNAAQGVSVQVSGQLSVFANVLRQALNPVLDKSEGAGNRQRMLRASLLGSKVSFLMLTFFYIPVMLEMPYIFNFWLKNIPEYAIIFCRLQLIRNLVEQLFLTIATSISSVGNIKQFKISQSILNFLPLIITYLFFLNDYPPATMYVVFIIYAALMGVITLYYARKTFNLSLRDFLLNTLLRSFIVFSVTFVVTSSFIVIFEESLLRLVLVLMTSSITFILLTWFVGFKNNERDSILILVKNKWLDRIMVSLPSKTKK